MHPAAAAIVTADPWHVVDQLLPRRAGSGLRRRTHRLRPAAAPTVSHARTDTVVSEVSETVELTAEGVPVVEYRRPVPGGSTVSRHDHGRPVATPAAGVAWRGFRGWLDQPPVSTAVSGLFTAGPASPAGNGPSQVVLSGALASYACHDASSARDRSRGT